MTKTVLFDPSGESPLSHSGSFRTLTNVSDMRGEALESVGGASSSSPGGGALHAVPSLPLGAVSASASVASAGGSGDASGGGGGKPPLPGLKLALGGISSPQSAAMTTRSASIAAMTPRSAAAATALVSVGKGALRKSTIMVSRSRSRSLGRRGTATLPARTLTSVHARLPERSELGITIVKDPKSLAMVEAVWETRIYSKDKNVRLMERPAYILSPNHRSVNKFNLAVVAAMFYVMTVTPYEVALRPFQFSHFPPFSVCYAVLVSAQNWREQLHGSVFLLFS